MHNPNHLLNFWFGPDARDNWFRKSDAFDDLLRAEFDALYDAAAAGKLQDWQNTPKGSLALVIALDQLPRNMFRGSPKMYATDEAARAVAAWAVDRDFDKQFNTVEERLFFYLPFEHSEDLEDQYRAVMLMKERTNEDYLRYAVDHFQVIEKFGRFPHRNEILGRRNTPAEEDYLAGGNAGW